MCYKRNETEVRVRYSETDQMGVAYHANYLPWFEIGRTELMRSSGFSYKELEDNGLFLPVLQVNCEYVSSAFYDDQLVVITTVTKLTGTRVKFEYEIYRESKQLAKGYTEHAFLKKGEKPVILYKFNPVLWDRFCSVLTQNS